MKEQAKVYRNLNRKCWSVLGKDNRLLLHADALVLQDCSFVVQEGGRQRVVKEGRKNVHAYAKGKIAPMAVHQVYRPNLKRVLYNPYRADTFVWEHDTETTVYESECVLLNNDGKMYAVSKTEKEKE